MLVHDTVHSYTVPYIHIIWCYIHTIHSITPYYVTAHYDTLHKYTFDSIYAQWRIYYAAHEVHASGGKFPTHHIFWTKK